MELVLGILLIAMALVLVVTVLLQSGQEKNLSGAIAGGADNFFGKGKGSKTGKLLPKITTAVGVAFVIVVIIMYIVVA